jgi:hypothetical protein
MASLCAKGRSLGAYEPTLECPRKRMVRRPELVDCRPARLNIVDPLRPEHPPQPIRRLSRYNGRSISRSEIRELGLC